MTEPMKPMSPKEAALESMAFEMKQARKRLELSMAAFETYRKAYDDFVETVEQEWSYPEAGPPTMRMP